MAGDWIKMRGNLWDDPRVARICDLTDSGEAQVIGALYWLWSTADQHTEDGCMPGLTLRQIDRKTGVQGFGAALVQIGWLEDADSHVRLVKFEEHNGASAKRRATDAQRKAGVRSVSACDADKTRTDDGQAAELLRRIAELEKEIEKEREKNKDTKTARKRAAPAALVSVSDLVAEGVAEQHATDWLVVRSKKDAPLTMTAWEQTKAEAVKAGLTIGEAIKTAAAHGWAGFKASWLSQEPVRVREPPITVPSTDKRADDFLAQQEARAKAASRPPAAILELTGRVGRMTG